MVAVFLFTANLLVCVCARVRLSRAQNGPVMDYIMDMAKYPTRSSTPSPVPRACYERPRQPQGPKRFTSAKPRACGISTAQPKVDKGTMVRMPITTMNNAPQVTPAARSGSTHPAIQITTAFRHILTTAEGVSDSHVSAIIGRLAHVSPPAGT